MYYEILSFRLRLSSGTDMFFNIKLGGMYLSSQLSVLLPMVTWKCHFLVTPSSTYS